VPRTVLIVDDDAGFRRVATCLLRVRGFRVVADAADGAAAIAAVWLYRPDCVLLDVNLPDRDGLSVAQALTGRPGTPSIVLTSTDPAGCPDSMLADCGARAFVVKDGLAVADLRRLFSSAGT
jgi:CheY-like chemotaxis protein